MNNCEKMSGYRMLGILSEKLLHLSDGLGKKRGENRRIGYEMKETVLQIYGQIRQLGAGELDRLYREQGISLTDAADTVSRAVYDERISVKKIRSRALAFEMLVIDAMEQNRERKGEQNDAEH